MKLNLVPKYVASESQAKTGIVGGIVVVAACALIAILMTIKSTTDDKNAADQAATQTSAAAAVVQRASEADTIIAQAQQVILDTGLANDMDAHNAAYPDLYDRVLPNVPTFFRVTSISAAPADDQSCSVTITGVLHSYQQYADLMLALLRIKGAVSVNRTGYTLDDPYVPALSQDDQTGRPIKPGDETIPDDQRKALDQMIASGHLTGFQGVGNFGSGDPTDQKGAMPGDSQITVTLMITGVDLMTPLPKDTLASSGSGGGGGTGGLPAPGGGPPTMDLGVKRGGAGPAGGTTGGTGNHAEDNGD